MKNRILSILLVTCMVMAMTLAAVNAADSEMEWNNLGSYMTPTGDAFGDYYIDHLNLVPDQGHLQNDVGSYGWLALKALDEGVVISKVEVTVTGNEKHVIIEGFSDGSATTPNGYCYIGNASANAPVSNLNSYTSGSITNGWSPNSNVFVLEDENEDLYDTKSIKIHFGGMYTRTMTYIKIWFTDLDQDLDRISISPDSAIMRSGGASQEFSVILSGASEAANTVALQWSLSGEQQAGTVLTGTGLTRSLTLDPSEPDGTITVTAFVPETDLTASAIVTVDNYITIFEYDHNYGDIINLFSDYMLDSEDISWPIYSNGLQNPYDDGNPTIGWFILKAPDENTLLSKLRFSASTSSDNDGNIIIEAFSDYNATTPATAYGTNGSKTLTQVRGKTFAEDLSVDEVRSVKVTMSACWVISIPKIEVSLAAATAAVADIEYDFAGGTKTVTVNNLQGNPNPVLIVASYDGDIMTDAEVFTTVTDSTKTVTLKSGYSFGSNTKIMLWDSLNAVPLSTVATVL